MYVQGVSAERYAELHVHTAYSFLDGASQPEQLVAEAVRLGLSGLAVTDHDGLYGVVRFAQAAKGTGLATVFGAELHLPVTSLYGPDVLDAPTGTPDPQATHLVVLARGPQGYRNLSRTIAEAHLVTGRKGAADYCLERLGEQADGQWLVLTGCRKGAVRRALAGGESGGVSSDTMAAARTELDRLVAAFGADNVAVESTLLGGPHDDDLADALAQLADDAGLRLVATGAVHAATPGDVDLAQALAAVRARRSLEDMDGWTPPAPAFLRSADEMLARHRRHPEAVATAAALADECAFDLSLIAPNLPPYPVPPGHDETTWLRELVERGGTQRYGPRGGEKVTGAWAQLDHELEVIESLGFPGYFLVVYDLVEFCRRNGILAQGRGSAANSAVCYALGVTAVDAVAHGLLFERFLAPERDGPPDIDVDIESGRREEVIQYVYAKHGREHAAQVANVVAYRPRSAVRDAARALGYDAGQQDAWASCVERWGPLRGMPMSSKWWTVHRAPPVGPQTPDVKSVDGIDEIPTAVVDLADRMLRLPRHLGIHPGGMVMCDRPVIEVCPVEWARKPGRTVLQWDKDDCADAGLVKFDLLGLGALTALHHSFDEVARHGGPRLGLHDLPKDDPGVYELLSAADSVGVFQVESRAQMGTLPRLAPQCFYDIVVEVALIRPGPIQGNSVHPYIERSKGREPVTYLHPSLAKSLSKTLGVPLFQEQLMEIAMNVAGFSPGEADQLRRAMGSKRSAERMEALHERLLSGMADGGIDRETGEQIFDKLRAFADFGFPESHAYSFAYLVYACSWLKRYHPAAFYAGILAAQPMGFYTPQSVVADARRHGIEVLRPDVQSSQALACVERVAPPPPGGEPPLTVLPSGSAHQPDKSGNQLRNGQTNVSNQLRTEPGISGNELPDSPRSLAVRMGLVSVRNVNTDLAQAIVTERTANGPFADLGDLARRVHLTTAALEALATAGALTSLGTDRRSALWAAGALGAVGPHTLPGVVAGAAAPMLPGLEDIEVATADVWATGVSTDTYPTQFVRSGLDEAGVVRVADAYHLPPGGRIAVAGVVTHRQRPGTANGITFLSLEDETGLLNVVCTAGVWQRFRRTARTCPALVVRGRLERADDATNLRAEHISPLSLKVRTTSRNFR
ncbi:MAG: error-prone DNA polymerase [Micrococcales bacterium]|nr:error-prone DNA polymerase [Micrococcales bacterium]MCL2666239.1 error-prone DNA polymerase [Micrococcales bacterium]